MAAGVGPVTYGTSGTAEIGFRLFDRLCLLTFTAAGRRVALGSVRARGFKLPAQLRNVDFQTASVVFVPPSFIIFLLLKRRL